MGVTVEYLKSIRFSELSLNEKLSIKAKGRNTPEIFIQQSAVSKNKVYIRGFNSEWYDKMKWLCGCEITNALFCFPCLLYGGDNKWTKSGFRNMSRIKDKCEKHQVSQKHMENVVSLTLLNQINVSGQLNELYTAAKSKHNELVRKNREVLYKMIDCFKFCGDFDILLKEHHDSENPEVFKGLINFIASMDPALQKHLDNSSVFKGMLKTFQNELLQYILEVFQDEIASEIDESSYLAMIVEETTDLTGDLQLAIIFRYEFKGAVHERFWGFFKPESSSEDDIASCLLNEINRVLKNYTGKLIAHTYNGTSIVKGEHGSVQQQVQQIFQNGFFTHSYVHQPYAAIKHVCSFIQSAKLFFPNLLEIASFFSKYPDRLDILDKRDPQLPGSTRWNFNTRTINTVYENKDSLINCFEELQYMEKSDTTIQASTAFLRLLQDETFLYWLDLLYKITPHYEHLYNQIQVRNVDVFKIQKALDEFHVAICKIRDYCKSRSFYRTDEGTAFCDAICEEARQRFAFTIPLLAAKLFHHENFEYYNEEFPGFEVTEICYNYPDLMKDKLTTELKVFYSQKELHKFNGLLSLLNFLAEDELPNVFTETIKLIKILVTIPMVTAEPERCFTTLKKVKKFLSKFTNRELLSPLAMISIEKEKITQIRNFNERVIEKFCAANCRRMDFIFK